ncbi:transmembrane protein 104-like isoform X1 [Mytilus galloprovincialis]|uniref:transmembrane protein 104-like isoform X1 n=2 Tax=Mytilus galloprovincialis TaxID=29158 RepID=UPI003F7C5064
MPEQITETGATYSRAVGLIYIFNLIVGTGALTMPNAFSTSGWLLSLITVILLAIISYLTVTFVTETMAIANAKIKIGQRIAVNMVNESYEDETSEKEPLLGNSSTEIFNNSVSDFEITERVELGQMAALFFNRVGIFLFYLCMVLYLYGDLAIYAAAVPKSLRDVICTYTLPSNVSCNRTLGERDICWNSHGTSRLQAYRIMVAVFIVCLGPFTFFNVQKTKYLQIFTTITRWLAFILMIVLAAIRLEKGQGTGHPVVADFSGIPNLFGVCIYSFMCHHSLPSLITPIRNKKGLYGLIFSDFTLILGFYALISFTGIYSFSHLKDLYTLNFLPDDCDPSRSVTNVKFFEYFLALFPVFTLSTNFPIISVTLRNNLKTMFYNEERPYSWFVDKIVFPVAAITPPVIVAIITNEVEFLVGITGSYAGAGIQYVIPAILVYCARKEVTNFSPGHVNPLKSPFKHVAWVIFVLIWACICIIFVTVNHIINKK